ncbi:MAG: glycosyltransferase family 4 protein, partial [Actinomycetota bacterium]
DFPPARGGIQTLVHRLATHLERVRVRVVAARSQGAEEFDRAGSLDVRRPWGPRAGGRRAAVVGLNLLGLIHVLAYRPQVVLSAHIVVSPVAIVAAWLVRARVVQYLHADELRGRPRLASFAVSRADRIIAVSEYTRGLALRAGADRERVRRIVNGVDPVEGVPGAEPSSAPTVITVARLNDPYKGHNVVMRAMPLICARVPGAQWVVVGEGRLRPDLEAQARALGVEDAVRFAGGVSDEERDRLLCAAHVFVMPSRIPPGGVGGEGFGIVYLEAGARGLPVVAGNVGGAVDAVIDGQTGVLVDPEDHLAVADAVADLLLDPDEAGRLGEGGRRRAGELSWPNVTRQVEDVLLEVAHAARSA